MKNFEVPLEKFEAPFSAEGLENPKKTKEVLVTTLRFLDKNIIPALTEFAQSHPSKNEVKNHELRTSEDGRFFLSTAESIKEFVEDQRSHIEKYIKRATTSLPLADVGYVESMVWPKFDDQAAPLEAVATLARKKFDSFAEAAQSATPFPEERDSMSDAVKEAGVRYKTPVSKLLKRK